MLQHCYIAHSTIKKSDGRTKRCTQRAPQSVYDCMLHDVFWMRDVASDCCRLPVGYVASNMWRCWRHCSHYSCCCLQLFMAACSVLQLSLASCCAAPLAVLAALLGRTANSASFFILKVIKVKMATATDGGQRRMQQRQQQLLQLQLQ